ncbi:hypothetical protein PPERSA_01872 [Pseudocohnilembus persalinus]|uniref:Uncharacterized protein n=1 Tax=Pseudocohnilembus persalinus TaxID=266149 RepID=A0A0V0R291_PSEPJ|nr:hypothetical protein PPERSA_01872 [Pseudocohnilembus persalinus]|eukprot:KRX08619.1 hypothetical protein PPERSA_01872 [Pseudocohnilembus persalinus]
MAENILKDKSDYTTQKSKIKLQRCIQDKDIKDLDKDDYNIQQQQEKYDKSYESCRKLDRQNSDQEESLQAYKSQSPQVRKNSLDFSFCSSQKSIQQLSPIILDKNQINQSRSVDNMSQTPKFNNISINRKNLFKVKLDLNKQNQNQLSIAQDQAKQSLEKLEYKNFQQNSDDNKFNYSKCKSNNLTDFSQTTISTKFSDLVQKNQHRKIINQKFKQNQQFQQQEINNKFDSDIKNMNILMQNVKIIPKNPQSQMFTSKQSSEFNSQTESPTFRKIYINSEAGDFMENRQKQNFTIGSSDNNNNLSNCDVEFIQKNQTDIPKISNENVKQLQEIRKYNQAKQFKFPKKIVNKDSTITKCPQMRKHIVFSPNSSEIQIYKLKKKISKSTDQLEQQNMCSIFSIKKQQADIEFRDQYQIDRQAESLESDQNKNKEKSIKKYSRFIQSDIQNQGQLQNREIKNYKNDKKEVEKINESKKIENLQFKNIRKMNLNFNKSLQCVKNAQKQFAKNNEYYINEKNLKKTIDLVKFKRSQSFRVFKQQDIGNDNKAVLTQQNSPYDNIKFNFSEKKNSRYNYINQFDSNYIQQQENDISLKSSYSLQNIKKIQVSDPFFRDLKKQKNENELYKKSCQCQQTKYLNKNENVHIQNISNKNNVLHKKGLEIINIDKDLKNLKLKKSINFCVGDKNFDWKQRVRLN